MLLDNVLENELSELHNVCMSMLYCHEFTCTFTFSPVVELVVEPPEDSSDGEHPPLTS